VARAAVIAESQPLFVEDLLAAHRADRRVGGSGVEADDRALAFDGLSQ
jgi:hypothetical protein